MKPLLVAVMCSVLATGCTRRGAKIGMGVGLGVAATGGLVIVTQGDGKQGPVYAAIGLASFGGLIMLISLVAYGTAVANEPDPKKPKAGTAARGESSVGLSPSWD